MHLERLMSILEVVGQRGTARVTDICTALDLPRPTAYRLVKDLVEAGLLEPDTPGTFALGARIRRLAVSDTDDRHILDVAAPVLRAASDRLGVTFFLSSLRGRSVEIVHVEPPRTGVSYLHPGLGRRPLHACSCAKAVAAFAPIALIDPGFEARMRAYTEFTLTRLSDLEEDLADVRRRGWAECVEEIERGMCSVAAPLATSGDLALTSIGGAGSSRVMGAAFRAELGAELIELARQISARLIRARPQPASSIPSDGSGTQA